MKDMSNSNDAFKWLELLSAEKITLKNSPENSIGRAFLNYWSKLKKGNFKGLLKDVKDYKATKKIRKRYFNHLDRPEVDSNQVNINEAKIAIYTCVLGGYDQIPDHLPDFDNADYFLLTDQPENYESLSDRFEIIPLDESHLNLGNILANRYAKFHPAEFFKDRYDYAIYLDGNVRVMADIRKMVKRVPVQTGIAMHNHRERDDIFSEAESCKLLRRGDPDKIDLQMTRYKSAGFPAHFGMNEATVIVSDLNNEKSVELLELWWQEFIKSESFRDQLAWPFVLWENNLMIEDIGNLGNDIYKNPLVEIERHAS